MFSSCFKPPTGRIRTRRRGQHDVCTPPPSRGTTQLFLSSFFENQNQEPEPVFGFVILADGVCRGGQWMGTRPQPPYPMFSWQCFQNSHKYNGPVDVSSLTIGPSASVSPHIMQCMPAICRVNSKIFWRTSCCVLVCAGTFRYFTSSVLAFCCVAWT